jgi:molybdopterin-guanine dinucleotide biosynthesis protein B
VRRAASSEPREPLPADASILAVAADYETDSGGCPLFRLDDVAGIADFIAGAVGLTRNV